MNAANWVGAGYGALGWIPAGGPDGSSHVATAYNYLGYAAPYSPALLRGESDFGYSGGSFDGDWINEGVTEFQVWVRHDAPFPVNWFVRFADPGNFPGAVAVEFTPVSPYTWTQISISISPANPKFVTFEGSDFASVFDNIGRIHIGIDVSDSLRNLGQDVQIAIDKPTILPEPASCVSVFAGLSLVLSVMRRNRSGGHEHK